MDNKSSSYFYGAFKIILGNYKGQGVAVMIQALWIFSVSISAHITNGEHLVVGVGIGPLEISILLHRWKEWRITTQ